MWLKDLFIFIFIRHMGSNDSRQTHTNIHIPKTDIALFALFTPFQIFTYPHSKIFFVITTRVRKLPVILPMLHYG